MALNIIYEYKSKHFSYSIRKSIIHGKNLYFVNVRVVYAGIYKQVSERNSIYGATSERLAKKRIMKTLKYYCVGTSAEKPMKLLPIFTTEGHGYQETLFNDLEE